MNVSGSDLHYGIPLGLGQSAPPHICLLNPSSPVRTPGATISGFWIWVWCLSHVFMVSRSFSITAFITPAWNCLLFICSPFSSLEDSWIWNSSYSFLCPQLPVQALAYEKLGSHLLNVWICEWINVRRSLSHAQTSHWLILRSYFLYRPLRSNQHIALPR